MSKTEVTIQMNDAGVQSILKGPEIQAIIKDYTEKVKDNAGSDGYETSYVVGKLRYIGEVKAVSYKARLDNSKNNTLLKALHD